MTATLLAWLFFATTTVFALAWFRAVVRGWRRDEDAVGEYRAALAYAGRIGDARTRQFVTLFAMGEEAALDRHHPEFRQCRARLRLAGDDPEAAAMDRALEREFLTPR